MHRFTDWLDAKLCSAQDWHEHTIEYQIIGFLLLAVVALWLTS